MSDNEEPSETTDSDDSEETGNAKPQDLRDRFKQFAQPFVDSLDGKLRDQVDKRVDSRVDATLSARFSVMERAIADLDRSIKELQKRLEP
jgi:hypothetical protein